MQFARNRLRWVHWPPLIHLGICLVAVLGYIVPGLQFLVVLWAVVMVADYPIFFFKGVLGFGQFGVLPRVWDVVAGTLWWYLLYLTVSSLWPSQQKEKK